MPSSKYQNSFNAGVADPLLYSRTDIRKSKSALKMGENVILLPQGGVKRRPGMKYIAGYGGEFCRLRRFRVGYSMQYGLLFHDAGNVATPGTGFVDVYSTADEKLTTVRVPWSAQQVQQLKTPQEADTMVLLHKNVEPHRFLRSVLGANPFATSMGSKVIAVRHRDHGLLTGDEIGISGAAESEDIPVEELNTFFAITGASGDIEADSVVCTTGTRTVTVEATAHGLAEDDRVEIAGLDAITISVTGVTSEVIPADELNRAQTVSGVPDADHFSFEVATLVPVNMDTGDGATGGGSDGTWIALDKYTIEVETTPATADNAGTGGASVIVWALHSLAPNTQRKVAITHIPKFNFKDFNSPPPASEIQRLIFDQWADQDQYSVSFESSKKLLERYSSDTTQNATNIGLMVNTLANKTGCRVEYQSIESATETSAAGHTVDVYFAYFEGDMAQKNWGPIQVGVKNSANGLFTNEVVADGGSTAEDVWSDSRGWPSDGVYEQRRLWLVASESRPLSVWASVTEDFFNFDTGEQQPSDAIDNTGAFDPIRHIVKSSKGLQLITTGGVVTITPDRDTGGYFHPLNFDTGDSFGGSIVAPVVLAGIPCYVDNIERSIRQVRTNDVGEQESIEASQFAQHLIRTPQRIESLRNSDGDYLYVANADGTIAVLCLDIAQQVQGWTQFTTTGMTVAVLDLCEWGGFMRSLVQRDGGTTFEKFDPAYFTDSAVQVEPVGPLASGVDHLAESDVTVRAVREIVDATEDDNGETLDTQTVTVDGEVDLEIAGVGVEDFVLAEIGLPFTAIVEPLPPKIGPRTRIIGATLDLFKTREILVDGYPLVTRMSSDPLDAPLPLVSRFFKVDGTGWTESATKRITQSAPHPFVLRGIELESA